MPSNMSSPKTNEQVLAARSPTPLGDMRMNGTEDLSASDLAHGNDGSPTRSPQLGPRTIADDAADDAIDETTPSVLPRDSRENEASRVSAAEKGHVNPNVSYRMEHGIYWRSPFMMLFTAGFGIGACLTHHFVYMSLRGRPADPDEQQIYLR